MTKNRYSYTPTITSNNNCNTKSSVSVIITILLLLLYLRDKRCYLCACTLVCIPKPLYKKYYYVPINTIWQWTRYTFTTDTISSSKYYKSFRRNVVEKKNQIFKHWTGNEKKKTRKPKSWVVDFTESVDSVTGQYLIFLSNHIYCFIDLPHCLTILVMKSNRYARRRGIVLRWLIF